MFVDVVAIDMESFGNMNGDTYKGEKIDFEVSSCSVRSALNQTRPLTVCALLFVKWL